MKSNSIALTNPGAVPTELGKSLSILPVPGMFTEKNSSATCWRCPGLDEIQIDFFCSSRFYKYQLR